MNFVSYENREALIAAVAAHLVADLRAALENSDRASIAVPGGTTPGPAFDILAETDLDWARVDVVLTDERWVDADHPRSNTKLLHERLLTDAAALANYVSLYTGHADASEGAAVASQDVADILPLSVVLLGMGDDMHTASLFPNADNLDIALSPDAPAVVPISGGGATEQRVSLSLPVLQGAGERHVVIAGANKREALARAQELNDPMIAPVSAVLDGTTVHWAE